MQDVQTLTDAEAIWYMSGTTCEVFRGKALASVLTSPTEHKIIIRPEGETDSIEVPEFMVHATELEARKSAKEHIHFRIRGRKEELALLHQADMKHALRIAYIESETAPACGNPEVAAEIAAAKLWVPAPKLPTSEAELLRVFGEPPTIADGIHPEMEPPIIAGIFDTIPGEPVGDPRFADDLRTPEPLAGEPSPANYAANEIRWMFSRTMNVLNNALGGTIEIQNATGDKAILPMTAENPTVDEAVIILVNRAQDQILEARRRYAALGYDSEVYFPGGSILQVPNDNEPPRKLVVLPKILGMTVGDVYAAHADGTLPDMMRASPPLGREPAIPPEGDQAPEQHTPDEIPF